MAAVSIYSQESINLKKKIRFHEKLSIWEKLDYQTDAYSSVQKAVRAFNMEFGNKEKNNLKAEK